MTQQQRLYTAYNFEVSSRETDFSLTGSPSESFVRVSATYKRRKDCSVDLSISVRMSLHIFKKTLLVKMLLHLTVYKPKTDQHMFNVEPTAIVKTWRNSSSYITGKTVRHLSSEDGTWLPMW